MSPTTVVFLFRRFEMALIRWEPVAELGTIQNEMNRLFNTFFDQPHATGRSGAAGRRWIPAMDLIESGDHYVLRADLPGLSDEDVNVQLEDNVLTISGERKTEPETQQEGYYPLEGGFGGFAPPPPSLSPRGSPLTGSGRTSSAACSRSESLSRSRGSPDTSRSTSAPAHLA